MRRPLARLADRADQRRLLVECGEVIDDPADATGAGYLDVVLLAVVRREGLHVQAADAAQGVEGPIVAAVGRFGVDVRSATIAGRWPRLEVVLVSRGHVCAERVVVVAVVITQGCTRAVRGSPQAPPHR